MRRQVSGDTGQPDPAGGDLDEGQNVCRPAYLRKRVTKDVATSRRTSCEAAATHGHSGAGTPPTRHSFSPRPRTSRIRRRLLRQCLLDAVLYSSESCTATSVLAWREPDGGRSGPPIDVSPSVRWACTSRSQIPSPVRAPRSPPRSAAAVRAAPGRRGVTKLRHGLGLDLADALPG
jgi:hypothetical protein